MESCYPQSPEHKAAISLTHFSCLLEHMKRPKDNEADGFGITFTMRGKNNSPPTWVSLVTHYTVETCTRTNATEFPPIVITGNTKRFTKWDIKQPAYTQRQSWLSYTFSSSPFPWLYDSLTGTPAEQSISFL